MYKQIFIVFLGTLITGCSEINSTPVTKEYFIGTYLSKGKLYEEILIINRDGTYKHSLTDKSNNYKINESSTWFELESDHFMLRGYSYLNSKSKGMDVRPYRIGDKVLIDLTISGNEYYLKKGP